LTDLILRLSIALAISLLGIVAYQCWTRARLRFLRARSAPLAGLDDWRAGIPAILYFTTPNCVPCRTVQRPALETLRAQFGDRLQIITIDASVRTDLADVWGVLSIPTTFIIDAQGQPRHINNGVVSAAQLRAQLREFAGIEPGETQAAVQARVITLTRSDSSPNHTETHRKGFFL